MSHANDANLNNALNTYIANIGVGYIKLHNLHWNVVGSQFKAVHEYLESLYDAFADVLDETAELLKIAGAQPVASLKGYLEIATIKELGDEAVDQKKALEITLADLELLRDQALAIRKAADAHDCFGVANLMEDHITNYAKQIWFLRSMLAEYSSRQKSRRAAARRLFLLRNEAQRISEPHARSLIRSAMIVPPALCAASPS